MALIRAILRKASLEWEWINWAPKVTLYREAKRRVRDHPGAGKGAVVGIAVTSSGDGSRCLATGLRESNLVELTWSQVDLERGTAWVYGDKAKGKEDIHVSLSDIALSVLRRQIGIHPDRVFPPTRQGPRLT